MRIPFVPLPLSTARKTVKPLYGIGNKLSKLFPTLNTNLQQAELDIEPREYLSIAFLSSIFWFILVLGIFITLSIFIQFPEDFLLFMIGSSLVIGGLSFFYISLYPKLVVARKVKDLERNLLFALRHLLIQVKSGVPLFDALVSVSNADYGLISEEFRKCVKKISTGMSETSALEELTLKNPSLYFRRTIWQIINVFRSGADLGKALENIVDNVSGEQRVAIRRYGSQLNPLAMMYMMIAVIVPSLGISFLIILSSFSGTPITKTTFWSILAGVAIFQFMFIGMIKSRRPSVEL